MRTRLPLLGSLLLLAGTVACNQAPTAASAPPDTHDADVQAIKDTEVAWAKASAAKDAEKFANYYADDGSLLLQDVPPVNGKDAIAKTVNTMTMTNPKSKKATTDKGKYLTVFKKQPDGTWKAVEDMISSDGPMTPAK